MSRSYLDSQSYEEVSLKLQGKETVSAGELQDLKIFSSTCAMEKYRKGILEAEQHGKKTFLFYVDDVLEHVAEIIIKREERKEKNQEKKKIIVEEKPINTNQNEFVLVNKFLIEQLKNLIDEIRNHHD